MSPCYNSYHADICHSGNGRDSMLYLYSDCILAQVACRGYSSHGDGILIQPVISQRKRIRSVLERTAYGHSRRLRCSFSQVNDIADTAAYRSSYLGHTSDCQLGVHIRRNELSGLALHHVARKDGKSLSLRKFCRNTSRSDAGSIRMRPTCGIYIRRIAEIQCRGGCILCRIHIGNGIARHGRYTETPQRSIHSQRIVEIQPSP